MFGQTYVEELQPMPMVSRRVLVSPPSTYHGSAVVRRTSSVSPTRTSFQYHSAVSPSPADLLLLKAMSPPPPPLPVHHLTTTTTALPSDLHVHVCNIVQCTLYLSGDFRGNSNASQGAAPAIQTSGPCGPLKNSLK